MAPEPTSSSSPLLDLDDAIEVSNIVNGVSPGNVSSDLGNETPSGIEEEVTATEASVRFSLAAITAGSSRSRTICKNHPQRWRRTLRSITRCTLLIYGYICTLYIRSATY
jgi:hypothetical protein